MSQACKPSSQAVTAGDQKFKVISSKFKTSMPARTSGTHCVSPVSTNKQQNQQKQRKHTPHYVQWWKPPLCHPCIIKLWLSLQKRVSMSFHNKHDCFSKTGSERAADQRQEWRRWFPKSLSPFHSWKLNAETSTCRAGVPLQPVLPFSNQPGPPHVAPLPVKCLVFCLC